ncbi:MAG: choice-of-anchor D domain-containing protein, partial [Kiritimatiellia bacterium]
MAAVLMASFTLAAGAGPWWATNSAVKHKQNVLFDCGYTNGFAGTGITNKYNQTPYNMNKDESDQFLWVTLTANSAAPGALYSMAALRAAVTPTDAVPIAGSSPTNFFGSTWRGGAVSDDLGRVLCGFVAAAPHYDLASLPVTGNWISNGNVFAISRAPTNISSDAMDFSHDSAYLYANNYAGTRTQITKWDVGSLTNSGVGLISNSVFVTSCSRVRNLSVHYIGGKDLVYYGEGDGTKPTAGRVYVWDTVTGNETLLCDTGLLDTANIMNVKVGGIGLGQMHLYVQHETGTMEILDLAADGKSATLVKSFTSDDMTNILGSAFSTAPVSGTIASFEVANDEEYAFFAHGFSASVFVVWSLVPELAVLGTNGAVVASGEAASQAKGTDFGSLTIGCAQVTNVFSITNSGNMNLAISGVTNSGSALFNCGELPAVVSPGASSNFAVAFNPADVGAYSASFSIANDVSGASPYVVNVAATVSKQEQTINFPAVADQPVTSIVTLAATASSGLQVTFAVASGPATISQNSNLTFSATGTVVVVASQTGDAQWAAAPGVT